MTTWIVVESMFGNTRAVADEIATALHDRMAVKVWSVEDAPESIPNDVDLLLLGGPTHAFSMSRVGTRKDAVARGATANPDFGIREWIDGVHDARPALLATAFDTRIKKAFVPGSAARALAHRLRTLGCHVLVPPQSFYVVDTAGPLLPGEIQRAHAFAAQILEELDRCERLPKPA
jgi:hypothetical protein